MALDALKKCFPDYAKDTKLNLSKVLSEEGAEGLSLHQVYGIALASAYTTKNHFLVNELLDEFKEEISDRVVTAAKAAATIMGMNNVYYRFLHESSDKEYSRFPANLRMTVIANPGVEKVDFELMSLAVSAINACSMCINSHVHEVVKAGISRQGVQSTIRIAAVLSAAAQALFIEQKRN